MHFVVELLDIVPFIAVGCENVCIKADVILLIIKNCWIIF